MQTRIQELFMLGGQQIEMYFLVENRSKLRNFIYIVNNIT